MSVKWRYVTPCGLKWAENDKVCEIAASAAMTVTVRSRVLFAVDRAGILRENEEAECPATGAYCTAEQ
ncbi:hypothetical protein FACS189487_04400 [Campylobacterota bacterium]|nr:hypothetical protein FACS189487_04400 [Campylobacterota bacterium]